MLSDLKRIDSIAYSKCYEKLSQRALDDISSWCEYSDKYNKSAAFRMFDIANSVHLDLWDEKGKSAYCAVSVYVTNYLNSA